MADRLGNSSYERSRTVVEYEATEPKGFVLLLDEMSMMRDSFYGCGKICPRALAGLESNSYIHIDSATAT